MRRLFFATSLVLSLSPALASADQLQCNSESVAQAALKLLPTGSVFIDFCSLCDAKVKVVRITSAKAIKDCDFELEVTGELVAQTSNNFTDGYVPGKARFVPASGSYKERLDLAYAYVQTGENDFRWLGGQLGLQATVNTASIQLPPEVYSKAGSNAVRPDSGAPVKLRAPAPSTAEVQRVFDYFRKGEDGPVLAHLIPCLKIDMAKRSPTRYECVEAVKGSVQQGTKVFAWTDWLVPRDMKGAAELQIVKDGEVKLARRVVLKGKPGSPIVPGTVSAKLSQLGIYTFKVVLDGRTLSEVSVEVRK